MTMVMILLPLLLLLLLIHHYITIISTTAVTTTTSFFLLWVYCSRRTLADSLYRFRNRFSAVGRTPWTKGQPVARPLPTQDNTTQKDEDKHPCLERDSKPRFQYASDQEPRLRTQFWGRECSSLCSQEPGTGPDCEVWNRCMQSTLLHYIGSSPFQYCPPMCI
jgi:hypothetical protein